ncbi:hypothetical protein MRX96_015179 [Rhipicephalus microplus]
MAEKLIALPGYRAPSTILEGRYRGTLKCDNEQRSRQKRNTNPLAGRDVAIHPPHGCWEVHQPKSSPLLSEQADVSASVFAFQCPFSVSPPFRYGLGRPVMPMSWLQKVQCLRGYFVSEF